MSGHCAGHFGSWGQRYPRTFDPRISCAQPAPTGKRFARRFEAWGGEQAPSSGNVPAEVLEARPGRSGRTPQSSDRDNGREYAKNPARGGSQPHHLFETTSAAAGRPASPLFRVALRLPTSCLPAFGRTQPRHIPSRLITGAARAVVSSVIPAEAGIAPGRMAAHRVVNSSCRGRIPAFAGMTVPTSTRSALARRRSLRGRA